MKQFDQRKQSTSDWSNSMYRIHHGKTATLEMPRSRENSNGMFRKIIGPILIVGQVFGVVLSSQQFKWTAKRTAYSLIVSVSMTAYVLLLFWCALNKGIGNSSVGWYFFYGFGALKYLLFLQIAAKWPKLTKRWDQIEQKLPSFPNADQKRRFVFKARFVAFGMLIFQLLEHSLDIFGQINFWMGCKEEKNFLLKHVEMNAPHVYNNVDEISYFEAICIKLISIYATFMWTFIDVFIVCVGMALTKQFQLFNQELNQAKGKNISQEFWIYRRDQWMQLCDLVQSVDDTITHLILMSFADNLFFVCKQLFLSLKPLPTVLAMVYFFFSLALIVLSTCAVCFSVSSINDEALKSLDVLYSVPSHSWNIETERFRHEISTKSPTVALTGLRFFYITRKMILSMAATILTYELVVFQFNLQYNAVASCGSY